MVEANANETKMSVMEELYNQSIKLVREGEVVSGKIVAINQKDVLVDVGFKSEGIVSVTEFSPADLKIGNEVELLVENIEDDKGMIVLSRDKAVRIQGWDKIVRNSKEGDLVEGRINKKVKGGFLAEVMGIEGFLPASLSMFKGTSERDIMGKVFKFKIVTSL